MRPFYCERGFVASSKSSSTTDSPNRSFTSDSSELGSADTKFSKPSSWSTFFASAFSVFDTHRDSSSTSEKPHIRHGNGWTSAVKKIVAGGSMRRIQECVLGTGKTGISNTPGDIWLLGACYKISQDNSSGDAAATNALAAFNHDFASRILITYIKGTAFSSIREILEKTIGQGIFHPCRQHLPFPKALEFWVGNLVLQHILLVCRMRMLFILIHMKFSRWSMLAEMLWKPILHLTTASKLIVVRHIPLDLIDPSLAIGFYCRDKVQNLKYKTWLLEMNIQKNSRIDGTVTETNEARNKLTTQKERTC
ncbi:cysteine protease [Salix suchowensis]|nr:cysteine protease [Salix suchowensis]